jgi:hypothetical protein
LTGEFLDLEREIDSFALQCEDRPSSTTQVIIRMGKHAGLADQLTLIEAKATELRANAAPPPPRPTGRPILRPRGPRTAGAPPVADNGA